MNAKLQSSRRVASALLLSVILAACASAPPASPTPPAPSADVLRQIESASTRTDHEALAAYYDREASAARDSAAAHRKMARSYAGARGSGSMQGHCETIVRNQEAIAMEYQEMASAHRQLAQQAKP